MDSAEALHRLLRASVATYGSLRAMAAHGQVGALIDAASLARLDARARLLDAFAEAWQIGRGRPLSREVLADAGVSGNYIDAVCSLAEDFDWNPQRLMHALAAREDERAKGFRAKTLNQMHERLTASGHLDARPPLDKQAVYARVLGRACDDLERGALGLEEVRATVEQLWQWAQW